MIKLINNGIFLHKGREFFHSPEELAAKTGAAITPEEARKNTIAYGILKKHNTSGNMDKLRLKFDSMASHDITYVGIIQTARASGMKEFPLPYVMTNCHNSLCAVGGTINEDDHKFALSAARKYGGIYVPPNVSIIHSYNREMMAGCGKMILASDSHTRYGALGTLGIGEGGGELAKQLVGRTYDISLPQVVCVYLMGKPAPGVGPHDVALSIVGAVYENGFVKNKIMEFVGDGVADLSAEYRNGIDVMTTETTCLSSVWVTDENIRAYLSTHGREEDYAPLSPGEITYYDGAVLVDLSKIEPTIALPFHPSRAYPIRAFKENTLDILDAVEKAAREQLPKTVALDLKSKYHDGAFHVDQGVIAGCAGGIFDNLCAAADILKGKSTGNGAFSLSIYPGSMPTYMALLKNGCMETLAASGAIIRECFCGPCFGAGDTPANGEFSIRHTTRNFPNREGSKPGEGQLSSVALMDARSIAATAINGGRLTGADEIDVTYQPRAYYFDAGLYEKRVYDAYQKAEPETELRMGPNIRDWPAMPELSEDLLLKVVSYIEDPVTTTDELIPSGETSSFRSNPLRLAEFTLSRKDPFYVGRAKEVQALEEDRKQGRLSTLEGIYDQIREAGYKADPAHTVVASAVFAKKPGDGSAREQAASCQRVLGGGANLALEYATKRYRSNLINWGMLPFVTAEPEKFETGDYLFLPKVRHAVRSGKGIAAYVVGKGSITLSLGELTEDEKQILLDGCLINYYKNN